MDFTLLYSKRMRSWVKDCLLQYVFCLTSTRVNVEVDMNIMLRRKMYCFRALVFGSTHVKLDVLPGAYSKNPYIKRTPDFQPIIGFNGYSLEQSALWFLSLCCVFWPNCSPNVLNLLFLRRFCCFYCFQSQLRSLKVVLL